MADPSIERTLLTVMVVGLPERVLPPDPAKVRL